MRKVAVAATVLATVEEPRRGQPLRPATVAADDLPLTRAAQEKTKFTRKDDDDDVHTAIDICFHCGTLGVELRTFGQRRRAYSYDPSSKWNTCKATTMREDDEWLPVPHHMRRATFHIPAAACPAGWTDTTVVPGCTVHLGDAGTVNATTTPACCVLEGVNGDSISGTSDGATFCPLPPSAQFAHVGKVCVPQPGAMLRYVLTLPPSSMTRPSSPLYFTPDRGLAPGSLCFTQVMTSIIPC